MWMWVFVCSCVYPLTTVDAVIATFSCSVCVCVTMAHDCWLLCAKRLQLLSIQSNWLHSVRCGAKTKKKKKRKTNHQWDIQKRDEKVCTQNMSAIGIALRVAFSHTHTVAAHRAFGRFVCHQTRSPCLCTHDCQFACSPLLTTTYISLCQSTNWKKLKWRSQCTIVDRLQFVYCNAVNRKLSQLIRSLLMVNTSSAITIENSVDNYIGIVTAIAAIPIVHHQQSIFSSISAVYFSPRKSIEFGLCVWQRDFAPHTKRVEPFTFLFQKQNCLKKNL